MSLQNLLELGEFERRHQDIPERDTTDSDRPKPKPRRKANVTKNEKKRSSNKDSGFSPKKYTKKVVERDVDEVLSFSSENNERFAMDNSAYTHDEEEKNTPSKSKQFLGGSSAKSHGSGQMFRKQYLSSDSESDHLGGGTGGRTEVLVADVHYHETEHSHRKKRASHRDDVSSTTWDNDETTVRIENELKSKSKKSASKPRPRSRTTIGSHSSIDSVHSSTKSSAKNRDLTKNGASDKEEYLAITIPPENDPQDEVKTETPSENRINIKEKLMEKWRKTTQNFLKPPSGAQSQLQSGEVSEEPRSERLKPKFLRGKLKEGKKDIETGDENTTELKILSKIKRKGNVTKETFFEEEPEPVKLPKSPEKGKIRKEQRKTETTSLNDEEDEDKVQDTTPKREFGRKHKPKERIFTEEEKKMLLGITIHCSDLLPLNPNVLHPVVKVTIMDENGKFLVKDVHVKRGLQKSLAKHKHKSKKHRRNRKGSENDEHDDESQEEDSSSEKKNPNVSSKLSSESVLPIMTQACQVNQRMPTFAPTWNELLLFEEPFHRFLQSRSKVIFFFEIMDFLPIEGPYPVPSFKYHGSEAGWYKVAWAFLKPVGVNGTENIDRKLRLQLYQPEELRTKDLVHGPEVFCWWKLNKRQKLNATLYVTVKGIRPPQATAASLRTLLSMGQEHLTQAILESQMAATKKSKKRRKKASKNMGTTDMRKYPQWTRLEGQSCKVPNRVVASLPSSQVAQLNLTVSGNAYCVSFSPCGLKLAAGLDTEELHVILIFEVPSGSLLRSLKGHHGLIYDLTWKILEVGDNSTEHYLASASADSTAIIWEMESGDDSTLKEVKKLLHPSFVYCVRFHPSHPSLVATGCFDYIIRVWDIRKQSESKRKGSPNHDSTPIFLLDRHSSYVNCLLFNNQGLQLFSGDGESCVYKWSLKSPSRRKSWKIDKDIKLSDSGKRAINSLSLHPGGNRLLVHIRDSCIKVLDIETLVILQSFSGLSNDRLQIRSCFSPCGNLVLSGSEDSTLCIWDSDTGAILQFITPENHPNCVVTSVDYHPYDHYVVIGLASTISEPNPILVYTYEPVKIPKISLVGVSKLKSNLRRQRSKPKIQSPVRSQPVLKKTVSFAAQARSIAHRGDSSEKFLTIIKKLDSALIKGGAGPAHSQLLSQTTEIPLPTSVDTNAEQGDTAIPVEIPIKQDFSTHAALVEERLQKLISQEVVEKPYEDESRRDDELPKPRVPRPKTSKIPVRLKRDSHEDKVEDKETENEKPNTYTLNSPERNTFSVNSPERHTFCVNTPDKNTYTLNSPVRKDVQDEETYMDSHEVLKVNAEQSKQDDK